MFDRLGIGHHAVGASIDEASLGRPEVGAEFGQPERDLLLSAEHDMDEFGRVALVAGELFGVLAELENRGGADLAGELGVLRFVGVAAEQTWFRGPGQEVGVSSPDRAFSAGLDEGSLGDQARPSARALLVGWTRAPRSP